MENESSEGNTKNSTKNKIENVELNTVEVYQNDNITTENKTENTTINNIRETSETEKERNYSDSSASYKCRELNYTLPAGYKKSIHYEDDYEEYYSKEIADGMYSSVYVKADGYKPKLEVYDYTEEYKLRNFFWYTDDATFIAFPTIININGVEWKYIKVFENYDIDDCMYSEVYYTVYNNKYYEVECTLDTDDENIDHFYNIKPFENIKNSLKFD